MAANETGPPDPMAANETGPDDPMAANETGPDGTDDAHANQSVTENLPTDPTAIDDPVPIDVTPVPSLRPGTVTARQRRLARGDDGENVYATRRPTAPVDVPRPRKLDDRQIATLRGRIADRIREWDRARAGHGCACPRCGGQLR